MKLVEIVKCKHTSAETLLFVTDLVKKIQKVGVLVSNLPGFVGNRMIFVYVMEAMLPGRWSHRKQGRFSRRFGMAMGPLQDERSERSGHRVQYPPSQGG